MKDLAAERAVLAGAINSSDAFLDADYLVKTSSFTDDTNQSLWACVKAIREENLNSVIDWPLLKGKAKELNLDAVFSDPNESEYIRKLIGFEVHSSNVRKFAAIVLKNQVKRLLYDQLEEAQEDILKLENPESIDKILALVENRVFDFTKIINEGREGGVSHISEGAEEYFEYLQENPRDIIGISSGYPLWDSFLGGLRRKTVNLIAARTGVGKSMLADNIALHVAGNLNIPVLYLDTEMAKDGHWHRMWSNLSEVDSREIENGKFSLNEFKKQKVKKAVDRLNKFPYYYVDISGQAFEETLAHIRRWLVKDVGCDENGKINNCLVIYDYLKLLSSGNISSDMKEYQILGFQMTSLHNFAVKFDLPVLSFVQLNRDGIDKETADAVSQSDRLVWLTSSLSIYKPKSPEEKAATYHEGSHKLIVVKNRYGAVNTYGEYINMKATPSVAKIAEGKLSSNATIAPPEKKEFEVEDPDVEQDNQF